MVNGKFRTSIITDPGNGRMPSMTPAATKYFTERRKLRRPNDGTAWWLNVDGPPCGTNPGRASISGAIVMTGDPVSFSVRSGW